MSKEPENINSSSVHDTVLNRFKGMSPEKKLNLSLQLYYSARELRKAAVKSKHFDWDDAKVDKEVREIFLYART